MVDQNHMAIPFIPGEASWCKSLEKQWVCGKYNTLVVNGFI